MFNHKIYGYYTHQPFLVEAIKYTSGNILECGCGEGSTLIIKEYIKNTNRKLVSLESNKEWLNKYLHLSDENHKLFHINANNDDTIETGNKWVEFIKNNELNKFDVVFLDSTPWLSRKCCFDYFLDKVSLILIHDFDYYSNNNIIGRTINKEINYYQGNYQEKIECDLSGIVKNYRLFYPPYEHFFGTSGPPTLICSNIMDDTDFQKLMDEIERNYDNYYR